MTQHVNNPQVVKVEDHILPCTNTFTYLGSKETTDGGAETDTKQRLSKAREAFNNLQTVWRSSQYTARTKLKLKMLHSTYSFVWIKELENDRE